MLNTDRLQVNHWRYYEPGTEDDIPAGWRCWIPVRYCHIDIRGWMDENMQGEFECDHRFNGGDPTYIVFIKEEKDATYFALNFI